MKGSNHHINRKIKFTAMASALTAVFSSASVSFASDATQIPTVQQMQANRVSRILKNQAVVADINRITEKYQNRKLTAEDRQQAAREIESALIALGYRGVTAVIESTPDGVNRVILKYDPQTLQQPIAPDRTALAASFKRAAQPEGSQLEGALSSATLTLKSGMEAEDKEQWAMSTAKSYAQSMASSAVTETVGKFGDNIKSQIQLVYDEEEGKVLPVGKLLVPVVDHAAYTAYTQLQFNESYNDRYIGYVGGGIRFYPDAQTLADRGDWGFGFNTFYGRDLTRGHQRLSVGGEFMFDTFMASANLYQRLSGWKASEDFDSYLVQERPANGWDVRLSYAMPFYTPLKLEGAYSKWYGHDIDVFGDTSNLQDNPDVYEVGVNYTLTQAINLNYSYKKTSDGHDTQFGLNFNFPLDNSIQDSFKLAENGKVNTINETPYQFARFEDKMLLQYRERPGRFAISYLGMKGDNVHEFALATGLNKGGNRFAGVTVTPQDQCVILSQGGSYVTNAAGIFDTQILSTIECPQPYTSARVTVTAGETSKDFTLAVAPESFSFEVDHELIVDTERSKILLHGAANAQYSIRSSYVEMAVDTTSRTQAAMQPFILLLNGSAIDDGAIITADLNGLAELYLVPDPQAGMEYEASIIAISQATGQSQSVKISVGKAVDINWDDALGGGNLVWGDHNGNGIPDIELPLHGGKPGEEITLTGPDADKVTLIPSPAKFDENGEATIIIEQKPEHTADSGNTNLTVDAGTGGSHEITITHEEFNPQIILPDNIEYGQDFTVTVTDAKPGSVIEFAPAGGSVPNPSQATVDANGNASVTYPGITDFAEDGKVKLEIEVAASASSDETKKVTAEFEIAAPELDWSELLPGENLVFGDADNDGRGDVSFTVEGGVPGQPIEIGGEDSGRVTVTDQDGNTPPKFGEDGKATITIEENEPGSGIIKVEIGSEGSAGSEITITPSEFAAALTVPDLVTYGEFFTAYVQGAAPNSEVRFMDLADSSVTVSVVTADEYGNASFEYEGFNDYSKQSFTVAVQYVSDVNGASTVLTRSVRVSDFALSFEQPADAAITDISTPREFILTGGKEGESVAWTVEGDGELDAENSASAFDANGEAKAVVLPKAPYAADVTVKAQAMSREAVSPALHYALPEHAIAFDYSDSALAFKGNERTLDYETPFTIKATGLTPNTVLKLDSQSFLKPRESEITVGADGTAVLSFEGISDTAVKSFAVTGTYQTTASAQSETAFSTARISLYQWTAQNGVTWQDDSEDGSSLTENNTLTFEIEGGRPNSPIDFAVSGSAQIVSADTMTDENGKATVTIQAAPPYSESTPIKITADHMGNTLESGDISLNLTQFAAGDLSFAVSPQAGAENTIDYDTDYTVTASGLLPDSTVAWLTDGAVEPSASTSVANLDCVGQDESRTCSARMSFKGIKDYSISVLDRIKGKFARNKAESENPQGDFTVQPVTLKQYPLEAAVDGGQFLDDVSTKTVTFTGGKPNQEIESLTLIAVDGELTAEFDGEVPAALDENGEAEVSVKLKAPYQGSFKVHLEYMGGRSYESSTIVAQPQTHEAAISVSPTKGGDDTIDYRTEFTVTITSNENQGLIDGSTVYWDENAEQGVKPAAATSTVANGQASMTFEGIGDANILRQSVTVTGRYAYSMADPEHEFSKTFALHQYGNKLSFEDSPEHLDAGESFTAVLSEARPGESVKFTLTEGAADAAFTGSDTVTVQPDGTAKAELKVNGTTTGSAITVQAEVMQRQVTARLPIVLTQYHPALSLPSFGGSEKTVDYASAFSVTVTDARPGTEVTGVIKNGADELQSVKGTVQADGSAKLDFAGIADYALESVSLEVSYMQQDANTQAASPLTDTIRLASYSPEISLSSAGAFTENESRTVTLSGGKAGAAVEWEGSEYFELSNEQSVFDSEGKATATVTAKVPSVVRASSLSGTVKAATTLHGGSEHELDLEVTLTQYSPTLELPAADGANTADYAQGFSIASSSLRPGTEATITLKNGSSTVQEKSGTVTEAGTLTLSFDGITDYALTKLDVELAYMQDALNQADVPVKAELALKDYNPTLTVTDGTDFDEGEQKTVTFAGGKAGAPVAWQSDSAYFVLSNEQEVFDQDGRATATVTATVPTSVSSADITGTIKATSTLHGGKEGSAQLSLTLTDYSDSIEIQLPGQGGQSAQIDYGEAFDIGASGLRPDTEIKVEIKHDGQTVASGTATVGENGEGTVHFDGIDDYELSGKLDIEVTYQQNAAETATETSSVTLQSYTLSELTIEGGSTFTEGQTKTVTVTGGKEGVTVNWKADNSYFDLSAKSSKFNSAGIATVDVTAKVPVTLNTSNDTSLQGAISAQTTLGGTQSKDLDVSVTLSTYKADAALSTPYNGIYVNDSTHVTDKANTIDFDEKFALDITDARPNTKITITDSGVAKASSSTITVKGDGTAQLSFNAISSTANPELNGKEVTITYTYFDRANHQTSKSKTLKLVNYAVTLTADKEVIIGNETFTVTAKGGKPGTAVEWSIEGNGSYTAKDATFDDSGTAEATVQGIEPYSGTVNIEVDFVGTNPMVTVNGHASVGIITQTLSSENFKYAHRADLYPNFLKGTYSSGLSEFTLTWHDGNPLHVDLALFGYPSREAAENAKIEVAYTASEGGAEEYPAKCWFEAFKNSHEVVGDGSIYELDEKLWGIIVISPTRSGIECPKLEAKHNGRYVYTYYGAGPSARTAVLNINLTE